VCVISVISVISVMKCTSVVSAVMGLVVLWNAGIYCLGKELSASTGISLLKLNIRPNSFLLVLVRCKV
jgi:hypothetical protein